MSNDLLLGMVECTHVPAVQVSPMTLTDLGQSEFGAKACSLVIAHCVTVLSHEDLDGLVFVTRVRQRLGVIQLMCRVPCLCASQ